MLTLEKLILTHHKILLNKYKFLNMKIV